MIKKIFCTLIVFVSLFQVSDLNAGLVDSVSVFEINNHRYIYIEGEFGNSGHYISRIEDSKIGTCNIRVDVFVTFCPGWGTLTPYDTTFHLDDSFPDINDLTLSFYKDTNTLQPCYYNDSIVLMDSMTYSFSTAKKEITSEKNIRVYPNPANDFLFLEFNGSLNVTSIELLDMKGRLVRRYNQSLSKLDVTGIKAGVYIFRMHSFTGVFTKLVIIE